MLAAFHSNYRQRKKRGEGGDLTARFHGFVKKKERKRKKEKEKRTDPKIVENAILEQGVIIIPILPDVRRKLPNSNARISGERNVYVKDNLFNEWCIVGGKCQYYVGKI